MTARLRQIQRAAAFAAAHLDEDLSLGALGRQAGLSRFHLCRVFAAVSGETPKQLASRLRLGRAAAMLLAGGESVLDVALACGFQSHEVFCRAFRRRFGMSPGAYRKRGFASPMSTEQMKSHAALEARLGACLRLYRFSERAVSREEPMQHSIGKKQLQAQLALVVKRRVKPAELAQNLGEMFGQAHLCAQQNGAALAGPPFARYLDCPPGLWTIEAGFPVAAAVVLPQGSQVESITLPGGPAAVTIHSGPYDQLSAAHAAVQRWIEAEGLASAGAPWESYVTDPAEHPDPKDWKTEVVFPLTASS